MPKHWTGDEFRSMLRSLYFRPGWKARNLDADHGRVYDLGDWRDKQAMVDWNWADGYVEGYLEGERVFEKQGDIAQVHEAMHVIEDELMRRENARCGDA